MNLLFSIITIASSFYFVSCENGKLVFVDKTGQNYRGVIKIPITQTIKHGWVVTMKFDKPVKITKVWNASLVKNEQAGLGYELNNLKSNFRLLASKDLVITFLADRYEYSKDPRATVVLIPRELTNCPVITAPQGYHATIANVTMYESWREEFKATVSVVSQENLIDWKIYLKFSETMDSLVVAKANHHRIDGKFYVLTPKMKRLLKVGEKLEIKFIARGSDTTCITGLFVWLKKTPCTSTSVTTVQSTTISTTSVPTTIPTTPEPDQFLICDAICVVFIDKSGRNYRGIITMPVKQLIKNGWNVTLKFDNSVVITKMWNASVISNNKNNSMYELKNKKFNFRLLAGKDLVITFLANRFNYNKDPVGTVILKPNKLTNCPVIDAPKGYNATTANVTMLENWSGEFKASISVKSEENLTDWELYMKFSKSIKNLVVPNMNSKRVGDRFYILNPKQKHTLKDGEKLVINFIVKGLDSTCMTGLLVWKNNMQVGKDDNKM